MSGVVRGLNQALAHAPRRMKELSQLVDKWQAEGAKAGDVIGVMAAFQVISAKVQPNPEKALATLHEKLDGFMAVPLDILADLYGAKVMAGATTLVKKP